MKSLPELFERNRCWAESMRQADPEFFTRLARQQSPKYLWIGCSDSRVPANQITGLDPGEVFVHRNVANQVLHSDFNALSVIQFAVEHLAVKHIIVCGHDECGGVRAALDGGIHGLVDNWIRPIREMANRRSGHLRNLPNDEARVALMCEVNVREQVAHVCSTTVVQDAWRRGQELWVHGWMYSLSDGLLRDLGVSLKSLEEAEHLWADGLPWDSCARVNCQGAKLCRGGPSDT